ncbi:hypothetical protein [Streptacidiphilus sp. P02-A3a]|uniref:hypothetical protein n=1 Tax=Streptacidiphilus sp. P02-A3a TaxID=2704468 RepID=UPI001CDBEE12|nr:hypothetical protein [Streptacidiphilus sp. P02-A3a]
MTELIATGRLHPAVGSRAPDGRPRFPARPGEPPIPLIGYVPAVRAAHPAHRSAGSRPLTDHDRSPEPQTYQVHGFLRRLGPEAVPSEVQRAAYRGHCRRLGKADGWELPAGYTFVTEHTRTR